ncbi:hypothetical protein E1A91_D06G168500v1 [Gossypium mustelinum]|uniref:Uncharacterized protein n=1 Tax=Gossypium mustelinum TaxID=34275 RepID=A0A5D2UJA1_GOSMU|nr:hypothetical protein E1A91_D06G168500v1 [Gossypium mustelinum]
MHKSEVDDLDTRTQWEFLLLMIRWRPICFLHPVMRKYSDGETVLNLLAEVDLPLVSADGLPAAFLCLEQVSFD